MGISRIVGIISTSVLTSFLFLKGRINPVLLFPLLHASTVGFLAAVSSHPSVNLPLLFGKNRNGTFPWWSLLLNYPYLFFLRLYVKTRRMITKEPVYNEVSPQLYVGGWPCSASDIPPGQPAVIDCTCELPKSFCVENMNLSYLCIPTWDTRAPSLQDIDLAVRWAAGQRLQNRPVLVHCAFGHGRSVAVMCALLVTLGLAEDWKDAEKLIKKCRPGINMNILHHKSLEEWSKFRARPNEHLENSNESFSFLSNKSHGDKPANIKQRISSSN